MIEDLQRRIGAQGKALAEEQAAAQALLLQLNSQKTVQETLEALRRQSGYVQEKLSASVVGSASVKTSHAEIMSKLVQPNPARHRVVANSPGSTRLLGISGP